MERTSDIKPPHIIRYLYELEVNSIRIVALFHLVGLAGLYWLPTKPYFMQLVPFHLWLMAFIVLVNHEPRNARFAAFAAITILTGWLVEFTGVSTGKLFGEYVYGSTLGTVIAGIPVLIGINWFILAYAAGVSMRKLKIRPMLLRILAGATLLVVLDILIEPVATRLDYWHWAGNSVPLQNYGCWFIVSAVLLFIFEQFKFAKQSMVAPSILICQFIFFAALQ